jgi:translation initiation factor IF-2
VVQVGQHVVLGRQWGRVRAMRDASGESLQEAFPGTPVEISGLRGMPMAGDDFLVQPRYASPPTSPSE